MNQSLISVIIPAWNEEVGVIKTIQSCVNSSYKNIEVIVVNDGSTDNTESIVNDYILKHKNELDHKVISYTKSNGGKASALNFGIHQSHGKYILTIDADSVLDSRAIELLVKRAEHFDLDYICGRPVVGNTDGILSALQYFEYEFGCEQRKAESYVNSIYVLPGCISMFRKSILFKCGLFPEGGIIEDIAMTRKIRQIKSKGGYEHEAKIYTESPRSISQLIKQRTRWRIGNLMTLWQFRNQIFNKNLPYWYSFVELPWAILINFYIILFPIGFKYAWNISLSNIHFYNISILVAIYCFYTAMIVFPLFTNKANLKINKGLIILIPFLNFLMNIISVTEFVSLLRSGKRVLNSDTRNSWDGLKRIGIEKRAKKENVNTNEAKKIKNIQKSRNMKWSEMNVKL